MNSFSSFLQENPFDPLPSTGPQPLNPGVQEAFGKGKYILVADDSEEDRVLLKKALKENRIREEVRFVNGGLELIDFLEQIKPTSFKPAVPLPCLILLDLYMPRMNGLETLRIIKGDPNFRKIPVIIMTGSHEAGDVAKSYQSGANSMFSKPMEYAKWVDLLGLIKKYWLEETNLPS